MYYVYVLQSPKRPNWFYKGSTSDLKRRLKEHNAGKNFSTAPYIPLKLIYYEAYLLKSDAFEGKVGATTRSPVAKIEMTCDATQVKEIVRAIKDVHH